ncbi:MAG: pyrroline-5-carboxylate reductase [Cyclobacteriaceae bacterium]|nr:pyrroline-5-carboxylate reductase [Cyclobacteriaceae bacterium]
MKKICIIGGGNLGSSIAIGLAQNSASYSITVTGLKLEHVEHLKSYGINISTNNAEVVSGSEVVILCVQPGQVDRALKEIRDVLTPNHILSSTATGVSTEEMAKVLDKPGIPIVRVMPNTATAIRQSMTCISGRGASEEQLREIQDIFGAVGKTIVIEEELMQAATVLGASGIAFFLRYIRAATQGGIQMGFHPHEAKLIAVQTAIGAATLVSEFNDHPEMEIDKVTTPRGCTIEGLNEMEHQGLSSAVIKGIMASYHKINNIR